MSHTITYPSYIYIIRHAEQLGDAASDKDGGPDLSIQGAARATALPTLFVPAHPPLSCPLAVSSTMFTGQHIPVTSATGNPPRLLTPMFVFAAQSSVKPGNNGPSSGSNRSVETITPTALALGLSINSDYRNSSKGVKNLAEEITGNPKYSGQVLLICWHHSTIPDLALALGVAKPPARDGKTIFDRVWQLAYSGSTPTLTDLPQQLLYGDSST